MKFEVREKTFEIELVNNYVHQLHSEMVDISQTLVRMADELGDKFEEYNDRLAVAADKSEIRNVKRDYRAALREYDQERIELKARLCELREKMLKEIIVSNGIEFDAEWWERHTDPDDINDFIVACVKKDVRDEKKKVKK